MDSKLDYVILASAMTVAGCFLLFGVYQLIQICIQDNQQRVETPSIARTIIQVDGILNEDRCQNVIQVEAYKNNIVIAEVHVPFVEVVVD